MKRNKKGLEWYVCRMIEGNIIERHTGQPNNYYESKVMAGNMNALVKEEPRVSYIVVHKDDLDKYSKVY